MHHSSSTPEVFGQIKINFQNAKKVAFDSVLRLFLSRCLAGDQQNKFEKLQSEIEVLRERRFDDAVLGLTPQSVPQGGQERKADSEVALPSEREKELVGERDGLLDGVLDQSLKNVLKFANDDSIREMLKKFAGLITDGSPETLRYESYADLCNTVLDRLGDVNDDFLRPPDVRHLRLKRTHSNIVENTDEPDLVRTFMRACHTNHSKGDKLNIVKGPTTAPAWPKVLSCELMKAFRHRISDRARDIITDPRLEYPFAAPDIPDSILEEVNSGLKSVRSEAKANTSSSKGINARLQLDGHAMKILFDGPGVAHVINTLIIDEFLYILYYDQQGVLSSTGISILADFPRFLVLLLAFQRFTVEDWGIVPCFNPQALVHLGIKEYTDLDNPRVKFPQRGDALTAPLYLAESLSDQSHRLSERMASVFKASNNQKAFGCKISSPEVEWIHEDDVLQTAEALAEKQAPDMLNHLSKHDFSGDLPAGNTPRPRSISGIDGTGLRTPQVVVMHELAPLTSLIDGKSFVKAWLDIVTCHAFLWKHGIEHGDSSFWNAMVDPVNKCGVLTDFDLTVMAWLEHVPGTDQTGTIPFMALDLLCQQYWDGKISRYHHHELEAFLWILPVVFLACDQGDLDLHTKFIKGWFTSDYDACWKEKTFFLYRTLDDASDSVHGNFKEFAFMMPHLFQLIKDQTHQRERRQLLSRLDAKAHGDDASHVSHSEGMWGAFIGVLSNSGIDVDINKLQTHKPTFDIAQCQELFERMQEIFQRVTWDKSTT